MSHFCSQFIRKNFCKIKKACDHVPEIVTLHMSKSKWFFLQIVFVRLFANNIIVMFLLKPIIEWTLRGRPFDSWGGGVVYVFFVKKKIVQQILENK